MAFKFTAGTKSTLDVVAPVAGAGLVFYYLFKKEKQSLQKAGITAAIVAVVLYVITTQITKLLVKDSIGKTTVTDDEEIIKETGATVQDLDISKQISKNIYVAFYGEAGSGWTEDEAAAVSELQKINSVTLVKTVSAAYRKQFNKSLKSDVTSFVHSWNGFYNIPELVRDNWF